MLIEIWMFFATWLNLFWAPIRYTDMLWIIIPIYLSWIITEIYQEKRDTSFGNAISNGVIVLWVGMDWVRTTIRLLEDNAIAMNGTFYAKMSIGAVVFIYGLLIMYLGMRGKRAVKYIARNREVSYILIVFTPMFYEPTLLTLSAVIGIFVFFPLFYFLVEFLDYITPDPKTYDMDQSPSKSFGDTLPMYETVTKEPPKRR